MGNLRRLSQRFPHIPLIVRTPLIPGVNDSEANLAATADFLRQLPSLKDYELLPYGIIFSIINLICIFLVAFPLGNLLF